MFLYGSVKDESFTRRVYNVAAEQEEQWMTLAGMGYHIIINLKHTHTHTKQILKKLNIKPKQK